MSLLKLSDILRFTALRKSKLFLLFLINLVLVPSILALHTNIKLTLLIIHFFQMRDLVTRPSYRLRKAVDDFIFWLMPNLWVPLYNSVTFSTMPYSHCVKNREWQDQVRNIYFYYTLLLK